MLAQIGVSSVDELFADIPAAVQAYDAAQFPAPLSELELLRHLDAMSRQNVSSGDLTWFRGGGAYRRFTPAIVDEVIRRGEFLTSYTPYQAEASQGTLQAAFEFQSIVCSLTGMEAANAGLYDGASSLAEACLMACRVTGRSRIALAAGVNPRHALVVETYALPQGLAVDRIEHAGQLTGEHACFAVQSPDYYGCVVLQDNSTAARCQSLGALLVVSADPMSLALYRSPGELGADIVVGEGQSLGLPLSYGGPYVGLFATRMAHIRQLPGRIVGMTTDSDGRRGFVLTLQAREQHIRRERASSNICTSEQLVALAVTVYVATVGRAGLVKVARLCYDKAHYAAGQIANLKAWSLKFPGQPFFSEFTITCPRPVPEINAELRKLGIAGGIDVSSGGESLMTLCCTETNTREEIDALVTALAAIGAQR